MSKEKRTPMRLQPYSGSRNMPTQMPLPASGNRATDIASILADKGAKHIPVKDPEHTAKARATRLAALRKQREATRP